MLNDVVIKLKKLNKLSLNIQTLACLLIIYLILNIIIPETYKQKVIASDLLNENIISAINKERSMRNLSMLNTDIRLSKAAQNKSNDMIARHYFSHTDPDGNYIWPTIIAAGYTPYIQLGENLAIEFYNTDSLISAWMNSPTHRANILNEGFRDQGMGVEFGNTQASQYYSAITNTFGTLATKKLSAETNIKLQETQAQPAQNTTESITPPKTFVPNNSSDNSAIENTNTPATEKVINYIALRGENSESSFDIFSPKKTQIATQTKDTLKNIINNTSQPVLNKVPNYPFLAKFNRYASLFLIIVLILLIITDLKTAVEKQLGHLDKKINNLLLLILSLIIIAFMYWF